MICITIPAFRISVSGQLLVQPLCQTMIPSKCFLSVQACLFCDIHRDHLYFDKCTYICIPRLENFQPYNFTFPSAFLLSIPPFPNSSPRPPFPLLLLPWEDGCPPRIESSVRPSHPLKSAFIDPSHLTEKSAEEK